MLKDAYVLVYLWLTKYLGLGEAQANKHVRSLPAVLRGDPLNISMRQHIAASSLDGG